MFSPQFMNFVIDPKDNSVKEKRSIPIMRDKNVQSDIAGITKGVSKLSGLKRDVFDNYTNKVYKYDSASKKSSAFASLTNVILGRKQITAK